MTADEEFAVTRLVAEPSSRKHHIWPGLIAGLPAPSGLAGAVAV
jgi:hypothetical protein